MPPALSDDEASASSGTDQIPAKQVKPSKAKAEPVADDDDEELEEEEFVVEKIMGHRVLKGELLYDVKWQGWDNPTDRTWEPESNLEGARDVLDEYFQEIGGRPEIKKRKGRKSGAAESEAPMPTINKRQKKVDKDWSPPPGSWEHDVECIDTVEEMKDPATGKPARYAYLLWTNHKKTQHPLQHVYQKCPQKMLQYYESHLVFSSVDDDGINGDTSMEDAL